MEPGSIIASGGYCAPVAPVYDLLPTVRADRGKIPFNNSQTTWNPKISKEERFLTMAMGVALGSKCKMKHGAIVVKHGHVRGASPNIWKNDPKNVNPQHCTTHAEIAALRKAGWPRKATIYVARVNNLGESRLSKPCANCQAVLDELKCKVVWSV